MLVAHKTLKTPGLFGFVSRNVRPQEADSGCRNLRSAHSGPVIGVMGSTGSFVVGTISN